MLSGLFFPSPSLNDVCNNTFVIYFLYIILAVTVTISQQIIDNVIFKKQKSSFCSKVLLLKLSFSKGRKIIVELEVIEKLYAGP